MAHEEDENHVGRASSLRRVSRPACSPTGCAGFRPCAGPPGPAFPTRNGAVSGSEEDPPHGSKTHDPPAAGTIARPTSRPTPKLAQAPQFG